MVTPPSQDTDSMHDYLYQLITTPKKRQTNLYYNLISETCKTFQNSL